MTFCNFIVAHARVSFRHAEAPQELCLSLESAEFSFVQVSIRTKLTSSEIDREKGLNWNRRRDRSPGGNRHAMLALPGPAFIVIPAGLAILATEFEWAHRLKERIQARFERARQTYRENRQRARAAKSQS
jgi:hypothetical protein